ncbi:Uncharacterised protein [Escherichia coli]|nr:Uncharacterised protein [Escherichia coli]
MTMLGIVPASKGFDAVQFTRFCEDLRLVNQFQLVIANRFFSAAPKTNALLPFRSSPG